MTQETTDSRVHCAECGIHGATWRIMSLIAGRWLCPRCAEKAQYGVSLN